MAGKRSPSQFRSKLTAVLVFSIGIFVIGGAIYFGYQALFFDYSGFIPTDKAVREYLPEDGFKPAVTENPLEFEEYVEPTMTPKPTLSPTPIPLSLYALRDPKKTMTGTDKMGEVSLTECAPSDADNNKVLMVRGWGYIRGTDASKSTVYLAVSTKNGNEHRFYQTIRQSGSTGIQHDPTTGMNLDQADFAAAIAVDTYADGEYRLGLLIEVKEGSRILENAYYPLDDTYNFVIRNGQILT